MLILTVAKHRNFDKNLCHSLEKPGFLFIVNMRQVPPRETFLFFNLEDNQLGKSKTAMYLDRIHLDS